MQIDIKNTSMDLCLRIIHRLTTKEFNPSMLEGIKLVVSALSNSVISLSDDELAILRDMKNYLNDLSGNNKPKKEPSKIIEC